MSARNPLEKFSAIFLVGGVGMFVFAFVTLVASPWWLLRSIPTATVEQMAREPSEAFHDLAKRYPQNFKTAFGEVTPASYASALRRGRDVYVAEACWHCHSQYVRPVSREAERFGRVSTPEEYQNELQMPQLFGTRRVGPDLIRVGGKYDNAWQLAHLMDPAAVVPGSVMPGYPWYFDKEGAPTRDGMALVAYLQWLGTWPPKTVETEDWTK